MYPDKYYNIDIQTKEGTIYIHGVESKVRAFKDALAARKNKDMIKVTVREVTYTDITKELDAL